MHNKSISGSLCDIRKRNSGGGGGNEKGGDIMCHIAKHESEHLCHDKAFEAAQITQLHKFRMGESKR